MTTNGIRSGWNWGCISKMKLSHNSYKAILFAGVIGFLMMSCDPDNLPHIFPHKIHFEQEVGCEECHELGDADITVPTFELCLNCHELEDDALKSCMECHEKEKIEITEEKVVSHRNLILPFVDKKWSELDYKHSDFLNEDTDCLSCHKNIPKSDFSSLKNIPTMDNAIDNQEQSGLSTDCQSCHRELDLITAPASHTKHWTKTHGRQMVFDDKESCLICHEEDSCFICHSNNKPKSHSNLWRRKTHGIKASFDRSSCMTCHRSDECLECHQATAPPVTGAPFHNQASQCILCHFPQGSKIRTPNQLFKTMPHRMMMGVSSQKCLECHRF